MVESSYLDFVIEIAGEKGRNIQSTCYHHLLVKCER